MQNQARTAFWLAFAALAICLSALWTTTTSYGATTIVVSPPEDTTSILVNPLMGFEDHNVNGTWYPFSTGYLRAGATCDDNGKVVSCDALNWDRLNPQNGVYSFTSLDRFVANMAARNKYVSFRIRNVVGRGDQPNVPNWAKALGVTVSNGREPWGGGSYPEIDYHKCVFLDLWGKFINEVVRRYDNHPTVTSIDIGSYGWYGEWFSGKTVLERFPESQVYDATDPTLQQSIDTRTRIIRMFTGGSGSGRCIGNNGQQQIVSYTYTGFRNKPVLISRGDQEDVAIGVANGAGIRFDAVGAKDNKQRDFRTSVGSYVAQVWQTKPIMGEFGTSDYAPLDSTFMQRSLCFAREFHVTSIHNNFSSKPSIDLNPLWRELGYRIVLNRAEYPTSANGGQTVNFALTWLNRGTAPAYHRYPLYLYFKEAGSSQVSLQLPLTQTDITKILPANVTSTSNDFLTCPKGAPPAYNVVEQFILPQMRAGTYDLYFGFEEPAYERQIQLAHTQKDAQGRYFLGKLTVNSGQPTAVPNSPPRTQYRAQITQSATNTLQPIFNVANGPQGTVNLAELTLRYYFTRDSGAVLNFACNSAAIGCSRITGKFVALPAAVSGADHYLEIGFTSTAGSLAPNGQTGEIRVSITKQDGSSFNQNNDYSFGNHSTLLDWAKAPLYRNGALIWGSAPSAAAVRDPFKFVQAESVESALVNASIVPDSTIAGGQSVAFSAASAPLQYTRLNFYTYPAFAVVTASRQGTAAVSGNIEFRLGNPNGALLARIPVSGVTGWANFQARTSTPIIGLQDVYITFTGTGAVRLDFFHFIQMAQPERRAVELDATPPLAPTFVPRR